MRALILFTATLALAQTTADSFVKRMMEFDKNNDEKLTRAEITDVRLLDLFDRADANKDGFVTRAELTAFFAKRTTLARRPRSRSRHGSTARSRPITSAIPARSTQPDRRTKKPIRRVAKGSRRKNPKHLNGRSRKQFKQMRNQGPGRGERPGTSALGAYRRANPQQLTPQRT